MSGPEALAPPSDSVVDRVYAALKTKAIGFGFKPGERLNEGEIAGELGVSRTPLREALNRLNTEGFLRFAPGRGFFCRALDAAEIFDLYELRKALEIGAVKLAMTRATAADIDALLVFLDETGPDPGDRAVEELVALDELFHERLMAMAANAEMLRVLRNVNARIRFVRWIDMGHGLRARTQAEHRAVLLALRARQPAKCRQILEKHIDRRMEQIIAAIKEGYARIYMGAGR